MKSLSRQASNGEDVYKRQVQETSQDTQATLGAQVSTAVSLLNNFIREIDDNELYLKVVQLRCV